MAGRRGDLIPFQMTRLGVLMEPDPARPEEVEGVLNPAATRGPDGELYLFPRCVGRGNHSEIGIARVKFDPAGDPVGVERLGIVLKPEMDYETWPDGRGGVEDPRISFVEPVNHYVMTYTAWSQHGPRIAVARSSDLYNWERLGLARYTPFKDIHVENVDDKDAVVFPALIEDSHRRRSVAMLHRPLFAGTKPEDIAQPEGKPPSKPELESIWISYLHWTRGATSPAASGPQVRRSSALGAPEIRLGNLENRQRRAADPVPARLAADLSWSAAAGRLDTRSSQIPLLRRGDDPEPGVSAPHPLSLARSGPVA